MKDTKIKTSTNTKEGWSIHIYDRKRYLRCTIEPSHGWAMGLGLGLGILVTVLVTNINLPLKVATPPVNPSGPSVDLTEKTPPSVPTAVD